MFGRKTQPIVWSRGNIFMTKQQIPYAIWRLTGQAYGLGTYQAKNLVRALHQDMFQSITGEYTILGLVANMSPEDIVQHMLADLDEVTEQWAQECALTYDQMMEYPAGDRVYFLVAPLSSVSATDLTQRVSASMETAVREMAALNPLPPQERRYETWKTRANAVMQKIPKKFAPVPVGHSTLKWITEHLCTRGANAITACPKSAATDTGQWVHMKHLPEPVVDEGDSAALVASGPLDSLTARGKMLKRRFVRIETPDSDSSYQQMAIMSLTPQGGFEFPGAEFVNLAAELPQDIDFCLRITSTPAEKVRARNKRAERNLNDQYKHRSGDSMITGSGSELDKSAKALAEYTAELNANDREVEIASAVIFAGSDDSIETMEERMRDLRDFYASNEWVLDTPLSGQTDLFWDFWPGSPMSRTARDYIQVTTGHMFSMGVPITSDKLGADKGFVIATNITTGRFSPVMMDLGVLTEGDISGSFGAVGDNGAGKSVFMKAVASNTLDRRGQLIAVDYSDNKEWAALADSLAQSNIIEFMEPHCSLDPIKLYGPGAQGARATLKLMTLMLGVSATDRESVLLNRELRKIAGDKNTQVRSLYGLKKHLASNTIAPEDRTVARDVAGLMDVFADIDFGGAFFDDALPAMNFSAEATVFCTHGMSLPTTDEMRIDSGRAELTIDKRIGRAAYAYLADVAQEIMYADDSQETLLLVDEAHHMTNSLEGATTVKQLVKKGRKHKASVGLATHSAEELGPAELRALMPTRLVFRTHDYDMAMTNLKWLDKGHCTEEYAELIMKDTSPLVEGETTLPERRGEALYRDHLNRVGKIRVQIPRSLNRQKAVLTTPPSRSKKVAA